MTHLLLTVQFFDERYHGLLDRRGPPEWPPSPFRFFSALVAGVARRGELEGDIGKALAWLQGLEPPTIIAPEAKAGQRFTRHVPNNDGDEKFDRQERLTAKLNIPTLMLLKEDEKPQVHYLWDTTGMNDVPLDSIRDGARSLVALGWGIDMAFANAKLVSEADIQKLPGVRWYPKRGLWRGDGMLRVPIVDPELQECTLSDLEHCHKTSMARIEHGRPLHTVDKPRVYEQVFYASTERPIGRPYRVFDLQDSSGESFRYPHRKLIHIAGMVRGLAIEVMKKDPPREVREDERLRSDWIKTYVAGHADANTKDHRQLSYLPLPSIGHEHTDPAVRRVMIAAPMGDDALLDYVARHLAGKELKPDAEHPDPFAGRGRPMLVPIPRQTSDGVVRAYTAPASVWHTFTPVILPGHDDHKPEKTQALIERALLQSGIDQPCEFEWSAFSRFAKSYAAHKYNKNKKRQGYFRPNHLDTQTAVHLTLRFKNDILVPGPVAIGAGRHCGLGLMAHVDSITEQ